MIQSPVYNIFYNSIINNGRRVIDAPLAYTGGEYSMDFEALERAFSDPLATMMILCNPHNPVGKAWSRNDLARVGELADRYHITVVSDEIHCDIMDPVVTHIPFASAAPVCRRVAVTCCSPSKAFNLAGLHSAYVMIDEPWIRHRVERGLNTDEVAEPNVIACQSTIAAYSQNGAQWLDALNRYIQGNKDYAAAALSNALPGLHIPRSEAPYLMCRLQRLYRRRRKIAGICTPENRPLCIFGTCLWRGRADFPAHEPGDVTQPGQRRRTAPYFSPAEPLIKLGSQSSLTVCSGWR